MTGFQADVDIDISFINVIILKVKLFFWELFWVRVQENRGKFPMPATFGLERFHANYCCRELNSEVWEVKLGHISRSK